MAPTSSESLVYDVLQEGIQQGHLKIYDTEQREHSFGDPESELQATMHVHDRKFFENIAWNPSLGLGEGYMDGLWDAENGDIQQCVGILLANQLREKVRDFGMQTRFALNWALQSRSPKRWARNISHHYDLGNNFYKLWLDESMSYTCALQCKEGETIEHMQRNKHELICRKIGLPTRDSREMDIADLGCGWGSFGLYAAKEYGAVVNGVTLSKPQQQYGAQQAHINGVRYNPLHDDYRNFPEHQQYPIVTSIGMVEHVYENGYGKLFAKINRLLEEGGVSLLHGICNTEDPKLKTDAFITKHIFPDGRPPRLQELEAAAQKNHLTIAHIEDLRPHYAETLRLWREKFHENMHAIQALGPQYDERFMRMWDYYLQASEAGFRHGTLHLNQLLMFKGKKPTMHLPEGELNWGDPSEGPIQKAA